MEHHRGRHLGVVAGEARGQRVEPEPAPHLTVGEHLDPGLLLEGDVLLALLLLQLVELVLVDLAALVALHRLLEIVVAKQASDDLAVVAIR